MYGALACNEPSFNASATASFASLAIGLFSLNAFLPAVEVDDAKADPVRIVFLTDDEVILLATENEKWL